MYFSILIYTVPLSLEFLLLFDPKVLVYDLKTPNPLFDGAEALLKL